MNHSKRFVGNDKLTDYAALYTLGFGLIFVGVIILILATILISTKGMKKGKVKVAGAVIIGPVPIIFGTDKKSLKAILVLSITLTALLIVAMLFYYLLLR
jgi:uncharacterized protein (TIGR00304 family)